MSILRLEKRRNYDEIAEFVDICTPGSCREIIKLLVPVNFFKCSETASKKCAMHFFHKILFPVDLSHASPKIAPYVSEVATKFEAEVHLLFVVRVFEHFTSLHLPDATIKNIEAEVARRGEEKLQEFIEAFFESDVCKGKVVFGDPADEILKYVELERIDLIVIGTHGKKGVERVLFGSVANRVVKKSAVPVLTVNPHGRPVG